MDWFILDDMSDEEKQKFGQNLVQKFNEQTLKSGHRVRKDVENVVAHFSQLSRGNREKKRRREIARLKSIEARQRAA